MMVSAALAIGILLWAAGDHSSFVQILLSTVAILCVIVPLYLLILKRWRWGIYCLIAYLPFVGLPTILSDPAPGWTRLIKDILFILPAYLGFTLWCIKNKGRGQLFFPGAPLGLMGILAGLLVIHFLRGALVNPLVGLIGLKIWLFYMPLYFLGYHLVNSKSQLIKLAQGMLILGIIPVIFGISQAALFYSGYPELAYRIYGTAAEMVTQGFAQFSLDPDLDPASNAMGLVRIPSLFTFVTQFYLFLMAMLPMAYALSMGGDRMIRRRCWYLVALGLIVIAAFTCGARAAYPLIPGYFILALLIKARWLQALKPFLLIIVLIAFGVGSLLIFLEANPAQFLNFATSIVGDYLGLTEAGLIQQFRMALETTWLGVGVGMSSGPARFAFELSGGADPVSTGDLLGIESFYAKAITEIGLLGLAVVATLLVWLLFKGYRQMRQLKDPGLRAFAVGLLALLGVVVIYLVKAAVLDYDPLNVYFWLYAGLLMKLPKLQEISALKLEQVHP